MTIGYLFNQMLSGITLGCSYALVGAGMSLIWGTLKMVNLAHGELYMLGAYCAWMAIKVGNVPVVPGILIGLFCAAAIFFVIQLLTVRPLLSQPGDHGNSPYILTMGLSILLQNVALQVFGERYQNIPYYLDVTIRIGDLVIAGQRLLVIVSSVVVIFALMWTIKHTKLGRGIRAVAQDGEYAPIMGVNASRMYTVTYMLAGTLAAFAGIMLAPIYSVNPWMGTQVQTKGLACCVLGGLGSIEGAIIGGIVIGIAEALATTWIGTEWKDLIAYLILVVVLWVKPSGIFGKKGEA